jgi:hypothetical protein
MHELGWRSRLELASTEMGVLGVCNDFVGLWSASELEQIPPACRPGTLKVPDEIYPLALALIQHLGVGNRATHPLLHRMSSFFTTAALRLAQVGSPRASAVYPRGQSRS